MHDGGLVAAFGGGGEEGHEGVVGLGGFSCSLGGGGGGRGGGVREACVDHGVGRRPHHDSATGKGGGEGEHAHAPACVAQKRAEGEGLDVSESVRRVRIISVRGCVLIERCYRRGIVCRSRPGISQLGRKDFFGCGFSFG